jgi:hypothetical protein
MKRYMSVLAALFVLTGIQTASAQFNTTVSPNHTWPGVFTSRMTNSAMEIRWFIERDGGRTIYSNDVDTGTLHHGADPKNVGAHATWLIHYNSTTHTVNIDAGKTHITNWFHSERCHVYENGECSCGQNRTWTYCSIPQMATYKTALIAYAKGAALNATYALQQAGYTVTRNP